MLTQTALAVALGAGFAAAVPAITMDGSYFVDSTTGNSFEIVGAAYQPGGSSGYDPKSGKDPLSDGPTCIRDAALMQILGVNAIRVYNIDPDLNHDECASIFNDAGMYMILDVNSPLPNEALNADLPWTTYNSGYLNRTFAVVEAFKNYNNTLAFFAGNEVISTVDQGKVDPPYIRAVIRDLKTYISKHASRAIPVGYSATDVREILFDTWNYLQCSADGDDNDMSRADLFGFNSYSWCGNSSLQTSGYSGLVTNFTGSSIPVFFSEFGCNKPAPRIFTEVPALYSSDMSGVFRGGIVYEYAEEPNAFGLVNISSDGSATLIEDYSTLKNQYSSLDWTSIEGSKPASNNPKAPSCSSGLIKTSGFSTNWTLPVVPPGAQDIIDNGVSPAPSGKHVDISSYKVSQKVYDADKKEITGLEVTKLATNAINKPGTNAASNTTGSGTSSTTTPSGTSGSASATSSNAAPGVMVDTASFNSIMAVAGVTVLMFVFGLAL